MNSYEQAMNKIAECKARKLPYLDLSSNHIKDISPVLQVKMLVCLSLEENPVEAAALKEIPAALTHLAHFTF